MTPFYFSPSFYSVPVEQAAQRLEDFAAKHGATYPSIVQSWRRNWERIIPFFGYPAEIGA